MPSQQGGRLFKNLNLGMSTAEACKEFPGIVSSFFSDGELVSLGFRDIPFASLVWEGYLLFSHDRLYVILLSRQNSQKESFEAVAKTLKASSYVDVLLRTKDKDKNINLSCLDRKMPWREFHNEVTQLRLADSEYSFKLVYLRQEDFISYKGNSEIVMILKSVSARLREL